MNQVDLMGRALKARGDVFILIGHYDQAMNDFRRLRRIGNHEHLSNLGMSEVYEKLGRYRQALALVQRALKSSPDKSTRLRIMNQEMFILMRLSKLKEVKRIGRIVQRLLRQGDVKRDEAYSAMASYYYNSGYFYLQTGSLGAALKCLRKNIEIAARSQDYRGLANSYNLVSLIYKRLNRRKLSHDYLQKSLQYFTRIGDISQVAGGYNNLGSLMLDHQEAINYYRKAIVLFKQTGFNMGIFETTHNLANKYLALGMCRKALLGFNCAIQLCEQMSYQFGSSYSLAGMAMAYKFLGDYRAAMKYINRALKIDSRIANFEGLLESTFLITGIKLERNSPDADKWLKRTYHLAKKINDGITLVEILYEEIEYYIGNNKENRIKKLEKRFEELKKIKLPPRENIFLKIIEMRMRAADKNEKKTNQLSRRAKALQDSLTAIQDRDLIFYTGKTLYDYYYPRDITKAQAIYAVMIKRLARKDMRDFYPVLLFLGAKLRHARGQSSLLQLKAAVKLARVIGKKRLLSEIERWSKSEKIKLR